MGDLIYSLPIVKHFGGGEFYLHLDQINWIGKHYYNSAPAAFHQNRMNYQDFEFMKKFMESQSYITKFDVLDQSVEITHNLDRFRPVFVHHPGNYLDIYCSVFGIQDELMQKIIRESTWLSVPKPADLQGKTVVINRTERWLPPTISDQWQQWHDQGLESQSVFVGLPQEYELFKAKIGWDIPYRKTDSMLELAQTIAAAKKFIGNQSQCLALAIGLGIEFHCELRRDLPLERNECFFSGHPNGFYF